MYVWPDFEGYLEPCWLKTRPAMRWFWAQLAFALHEIIQRVVFERRLEILVANIAMHKLRDTVALNNCEAIRTARFGHARPHSAA